MIVNACCADLQVYMIGDRVQAKWEDGKMYFGKVLQVYEGIMSK